VTNYQHGGFDYNQYTSYLRRYWMASQTGITSFSCTVTFQYVQGDVVLSSGQSEAAIAYWKYEATGNPQWTVYNYADVTNNLLTGIITRGSTRPP
jgi:hypothetical protein